MLLSLYSTNLSDSWICIVFSPNSPIAPKFQMHVSPKPPNWPIITYLVKLRRNIVKIHFLSIAYPTKLIRLTDLFKLSSHLLSANILTLPNARLLLKVNMSKNDETKAQIMRLHAYVILAAEFHGNRSVKGLMFQIYLFECFNEGKYIHSQSINSALNWNTEDLFFFCSYSK